MITPIKNYQTRVGIVKAAWEGDLETVKNLLKESNIDVNDDSGFLVQVRKTTENGYDYLYEPRLASAYDIDDIKRCYPQNHIFLATPLNAAIVANHKEVVAYLLDNGANPNKSCATKSEQHRLPLVFFIPFDNIDKEILEALLNKVTDSNLLDGVDNDFMASLKGTNILFFEAIIRNERSVLANYSKDDAQEFLTADAVKNYLTYRHFTYNEGARAKQGIKYLFENNIIEKTDATQFKQIIDDHRYALAGLSMYAQNGYKSGTDTTANTNANADVNTKEEPESLCIGFPLGG